MGQPFYILFSTFILLILAYILYRYISNRRYKAIKIKYKPITSKNTIIAFDLHDVLVRYDYMGITKEFWQGENKFWLFVAFLNPFLIYDAIKLLLQGGIAEQFILGLPKKYPRLRPYIPLGIRIANCQTPNIQMLQFLKKLKKSGYTIHLFSNIGAEIYKDLQEKLPEVFIDIDSTTLPSQKNGYIRKPFKNAFEQYASQHKNKNILFIDDKRKNIKMARSIGIIGILFTSSCQIIQEFKKLEII